MSDKRGRPTKAEPTRCECIVCRLADMEVEWPEAIAVLDDIVAFARKRLDLSAPVDRVGGEDDR